MPHLNAFGFGRSMRVVAFQTYEGMAIAPDFAYLGNDTSKRTIYSIWNMALFHKPLIRAVSTENADYRVTIIRDGTSATHGNARLGLKRLSAFKVNLGGQVAFDWIPKSGDIYCGESSRVCCVATPSSVVNEAVGFGYENRESFSEFYEDIGQGVFLARESKRRATFLCGAFDGDELRKPWISFGGSDANHGNPYVSYATLYESEAMFPLGVLFSSSSGETLAGGGVLHISSDSGDAKLFTMSSQTNGGTKCLICRDRDSGQLFASAFCGNGTGFDVAVSGSSFATGDFPPNVIPVPLPAGIEHFLWSSGTYSLSMSVSNLDVAGRDSAIFDDGSSATTPLLVLGGVENSTPASMVATQEQFDWGAIVRVPFLSNSTQTLQEKDGLFERPQYDKLNSPSILSIENPHFSPSFSEEVPDDENRVFRKPDGPMETTSGILSDEPLELVSLKSTAMCSGAYPVGDEDVCFPVIELVDQEKFLFRGKTIIGTGVEFVPFSSNTSPIESAGLTQQRQPNATPPTSSSGLYGTIYSGSKPANDASGKWYYFSDQLFIDSGGPDQSFVSILQDTSPGSVRLYDGDRWSRVTDDPGLITTYQPKQAFDEQGWMAGSVAAALQNGIALNAGELPQGVLPVTPPSSFTLAIQENQFTSRNPASTSYFPYPIQPTKNLIDLSAIVRPSIAGKEFVCAREPVRGLTMQCGMFHHIGEGTSFTKTAVRNFVGRKSTQRYSFSPAGSGWNVSRDLSSSDWNGKATHTVSFITDVVELYVVWTVSLQPPGPYKVTGSITDGIAEFDIPGYPSSVLPRMFVKGSRANEVTPVLVATVWCRAVGTVGCQSVYEFPAEFGTSGTYTHKAKTRTHTQQNLERDFGEASIGHKETWVKGEPVSSDKLDWRFMGHFPFNRAQTQQLLDGNTVQPTYWYVGDEGSQEESTPVAVAWHNTTFGTYRLKFRLVTE